MSRCFPHSCRSSTSRSTEQNVFFLIVAAFCNHKRFNDGFDDSRLTAAGAASDYRHVLAVTAIHRVCCLLLSVVQQKAIFHLHVLDSSIHIGFRDYAARCIHAVVQCMAKERDVAFKCPVSAQINAEERFSACVPARLFCHQQSFSSRAIHSSSY